ncbi:hypothetical protein [Streptomyces sirii]|uniref:hypothetical protein n=1 Tax=Streptomyces sirii TaxID=3127701 RepID=UPI003D3664CB
MLKQRPDRRHGSLVRRRHVRVKSLGSTNLQPAADLCPLIKISPEHPSEPGLLVIDMTSSR